MGAIHVQLWVLQAVRQRQCQTDELVREFGLQMESRPTDLVQYNRKLEVLLNLERSPFDLKWCKYN